MSPTDFKPCCLDCRWCSLRAGWYGTTRYRCTLTAKAIDSSRVLVEACDRYQSWRVAR